MVDGDMEEIDQVREFEEANYKEARRGIGETVAITQDLLDVYSFFGEMIKTSKLGARDEISVLQILSSRVVTS